MNSHIAAYKKNMFANNWAEMPPYLWPLQQNRWEKEV
jgi:hypothetical protein